MPFPWVPALPHCGFMGSNTVVHFPLFVLKTVSSAFGLAKFTSFSLGDGGERKAKPVIPNVFHIPPLSMITSYTSSKHNNQKACFHPSLVFDNWNCCGHRTTYHMSFCYVVMCAKTPAWSCGSDTFSISSKKKSEFQKKSLDWTNSFCRI